MRICDNIAVVIDHTPSGEMISIVAGNYPASEGNTFSVGDDGKEILIDAPVGDATIGE